MRAYRLILASLSAPASLWAQGEVARTCDFRFLPKPEAVEASIRPSHPDVAFDGMAERMAKDEWVFLVDSIRRSVQSNPAVEAPERQVLIDQLGITHGELNNAMSTDGRFTLAGVTTDRFRVVPPTPSQPEGEYTLFLTSATPLKLDALKAGSRRAVCWSALAVARMLTAFGAPARQAAADALEKAVHRWDNYGSKGYSQFPWELAWNSRGFSAKRYDPPRTQKVFLHPALGLELAGPKVKQIGDLANLQTTEVVTLEPFGYLLYNENRSFYWGVSTLVTLADERRLGGGAMVHLGQAIKAGYVVRRRDASGRRGQSFIVSADLVQFVMDVPQKLKEWKGKALAQGVAAWAPSGR